MKKVTVEERLRRIEERLDTLQAYHEGHIQRLLDMGTKFVEWLRHGREGE